MPTRLPGAPAHILAKGGPASPSTPTLIPGGRGASREQGSRGAGRKDSLGLPCPRPGEAAYDSRWCLPRD
jgi:hypothetical protein